MTPIDRRSEILEQIRQCVCKDRCKTHGEAEQNFADIAYVWNWWLKSRYNAHVRLDELDVAEMMNLMKSTRKAKTPFHLDHWVDGGGYNVCGAGIVKKALETVKHAESLAAELNGIASAEPHTEQDLKLGMDKLISDLEKSNNPTVDHGEEELKKQNCGVGNQYPWDAAACGGKTDYSQCDGELKKFFQLVGKQEPATSKTLDGKTAVLESLVNPIPPRCGHASDSGFTVGVCCLNYGHSGSHIHT